MSNVLSRTVLLATSLWLAACTSVTIDEYQSGSPTLAAEEIIVVLGRRHSPDYETEPDLISCVGKLIAGGANKINVIDEKAFTDALYPWFEPRMAPLKLSRLSALKAQPLLQQKMQELKVRYMIWIDGNTRTTKSSGAIGCAIGIGGGGCFGFGSWDEKSDYEASIWDYQQQKLMGKISADAHGTSYMPALVIPVPLLARVQSNACKGLGGQLQQLFNPKP